MEGWGSGGRGPDLWGWHPHMPAPQAARGGEGPTQPTKGYLRKPLPRSLLGTWGPRGLGGGGYHWNRGGLRAVRARASPKDATDLILLDADEDDDEDDVIIID